MVRDSGRGRKVSAADDVWPLTVGQKTVIVSPEEDYGGWILWSRSIAEQEVAGLDAYVSTILVAEWCRFVPTAVADMAFVAYRQAMRRTRALVPSAVIALALALAVPAQAHQPVELGPSDTTAARGPMLPDGTVSYAVRAAVKSGEQRGFRFRLKQGDRVAVQLLIFDVPPANALPASQLPSVTVTDPRGRRTRLPARERTEFFEPYTGRTYLYLSRMDQAAVPGEYSILVRGRSSTTVDATIGVGYREVPGQVVR